jgi:ferredoxin-type protein NapH
MRLVRDNGWLIARRATQLTVLGVFLLGPWLGIWWVKGNLSSSMTLEMLPLTDPFVLTQTLVAGHTPETTAVTGALIGLLAYLLLGGRAFCAWVCPVNVVTDGAHWLRQKLGLTGNLALNRKTRYWLLGTIMAAALVTGVAAWELVNPVSTLHRGLIFGMGLGWFLIGGIFLFDLAVQRRGWCGHLCPMGAFYSLLGLVTPLRVGTVNRAACNDCMDCYRVCPEPHILKPALKDADHPPLVTAIECTNCARCLDVCNEDVFKFANRYWGVPPPIKEAES